MTHINLITFIISFEFKKLFWFNDKYGKYGNISFLINF
jgi:hypothetical protein